MIRLNKSVQIDPRFSWVDWGLYEVPMSVGAANDLNTLLKELVNSGNTQDQVLETMLSKMEDLRGFGASDTEPMQFLEAVLKEIYN